MRKRKRILFTRFASYDRDGIERFLEKQAQKGWMLDAAYPCWTFRRIAPKKIHFAVCYFPDAKDFYPVLTYKQEEFLEFCAHTGWSLVCNTPQTLILCNEETDPVPIGTDPVIEVENIHRATKKRFLNNWTGVPVAWMTLHLSQGLRGFQKSVIEELSAPHYFTAAAMLIVLALLWGLEFGLYYLWYKKALVMAKQENRFYPARFPWNFWPLLQVATVIGGICLNFSYYANRLMIIAELILLLYLGVSILGVKWLSYVLKKKNVPQALRRIGTVFLSVALIIGLFVLTESPAFPNPSTDRAAEKTVCQCEYRDEPHMVFRDNLPLRKEDLSGEEYAAEGYMTYWEGRASPLLGQFHARQVTCGANTLIKYTILEIKVPSLYDDCLDEMLTQEQINNRYRLICENRLGASQIYQLYHSDEARSTYLFCFEDRIIELYTDWLLTEEQLTIVSEKLIDCPLPTN